MSATERTVAPYGSWRSPISARMCATSGVRLTEPTFDGGGVYWLEGRPTEGGRQVLVRRAPGSDPIDVTPASFNARDKVHEYGGGPYVAKGGDVVFANFEDQRLYRQAAGDEPRPIVPQPSIAQGTRYADPCLDPSGEVLVCVRETHAADGLPVNEIVALRTDGSGEPVVLATGRDFYAFPTLSPEGDRLAWVCWDMPNMPWDGTELWVSAFADARTAGEPELVAGSATESIFQPAWSGDRALHYVSDRSGWWNLYRREPSGDETNLTPLEAEFAVPMWQFGYRSYAFLDDGRIACIFHRAGEQHLGVLDPASGELLDLDLPYATFDPPYLRAEGTRLVFVAGGPAIPRQVVELDLVTRSVEVLRESEELAFDPAYVSVPEVIEFPTEDGLTAFGYHYAPANPAFAGPEGERPPLIVMCHGGPTSETSPELDLNVQYFTSRGFAVVDVNYGGSTGYGRAFQRRLLGNWGVLDVDDCVNAARFLVRRGDADPERVVITGGSAGGWTTLCALTFRGEMFATGASYFGVSDLESFAQITHKFELRYLDNLVGPRPEADDVWRSRSPARSAHLLSRPMILFQGLEDEVVPPAQSEIMVRALEEKGVPFAYLAFEGEQHGFRRAENIARSLEAELYFYSRILGFELADPVEPVEIHNLA